MNERHWIRQHPSFVGMEMLRDVVGAEQTERALWWAGPNTFRLEAARDKLLAGQTLDDRGEWRAPSMRSAADIREALAAVTRA